MRPIFTGLALFISQHRFPFKYLRGVIQSKGRWTAALLPYICPPLNQMGQRERMCGINPAINFVQPMPFLPFTRHCEY